MDIPLISKFQDFIFDWHTSVMDAVFAFYADYSRVILNSIHFALESGFNALLIITAILAAAYLVMGVMVIFKRKTKSLDHPRGSEPMVTVQIPTYNELAALNCAKRALEFDWPQEKLQIIIGDDSNDPAVSARIDAFAAKHAPRITVTRRGENIGFKPGNLEHMLKYTNGDFIAIFDSDFLPEKDYLRKMMTPFADANVSVVQARWRIENFTQNIFSVLGGTISLLCHNITLEFINLIKGNGFLCGSAEIIRKRHLREVGGWRIGCLTEDIECSMRLIKSGRKLVYLEDVECGCEAPYTFKDLCKQQMRWAYGVMDAMKLHLANVIWSRAASFRSKMSVAIFASGYFFSGLLLAITVFGIFSILSNEPAPIDWALFLSETGRNIIFTSGFVLASVVALVKGKQAKQLPKMVLGSLSIGLAVTYYVNVGLIKSVFGRGMHWFMLKKNGNETLE